MKNIVHYFICCLLHKVPNKNFWKHVTQFKEKLCFLEAALFLSQMEFAKASKLLRSIFEILLSSLVVLFLVFLILIFSFLIVLF